VNQKNPEPFQMVFNCMKELVMKYLMCGIALLCSILAPISVYAGTAVPAGQCVAWFNKIDRNGDGAIGHSENAAYYMHKITLAGPESSAEDNMIMSRTFFLAECRIGSLGKPKL
jgi:hypothetical protein